MLWLQRFLPELSAATAAEARHRRRNVRSLWGSFLVVSTVWPGLLHDPKPSKNNEDAAFVVAFQPPASRPQQQRRGRNVLAATAAKSGVKRRPSSEVVELFDDCASSFEDILCDDLEYSAPKRVAQAAAERIGNSTTAATAARSGKLYKSAIDAGCGTGLIGPFLRPLVDGPMVGVDLSPRMVEKAAELVADNPDGQRKMSDKHNMRRVDELARQAQNLPRLYDGLFVGDLLDLSKSKPMEGYGHVLTRGFPEHPVELIVCADVLCYFGSMGEILQAFSERLAPGGDLVFTTETMESGDYNWVQLVSDRYAHCPDYVHRMAAKADLTMVSQEDFSPRLEMGEKVLGTLHTFTKEE